MKRLMLILNNGFKDSGELREAIAYDMYAFRSLLLPFIQTLLRF